MTGILLARRDTVCFVATPPGPTDQSRMRHETLSSPDVVTIAVSEDEFQKAALDAGGAGIWPHAAPRPDLLAAMVSTLSAIEGMDLSIHTSHEGAAFRSLSADGRRDTLVVEPADVLGLLASLFQRAPRGVIALDANLAERLLITVRPDREQGQFRARIAAAVGAPPADLTAAGVPGGLMERILQASTAGPGILLVAGTPGSGRSTTLALLSAALIARGMKGVSLGPTAAPEGIASPDGMERICGHWPFLDSIPAEAWDFVVIDAPEESADLALAARAAGRGRFVIMSHGPGEAGILAHHVAGLLQSAAVDVGVSVLAQDLVRRVCADCATWISLPAERSAGFGFHQSDRADFARHGGLPVPQGGRCARCRSTGTRELVGVFEYAGTRDLTGTLPRMREDGWSKVFMGQAHYEDVMALPGAGVAMRPMREVGASAARVAAAAAARFAAQPANPTAVATGAATDIEDPLEQPFGTPAGPRSDSVTFEVEDGPAPGSALTDADAWARLLDEARTRDADGRRLDELIAIICRRASGEEPLMELLAPSRGFHLARHMVNTALLAVRIGRAMETRPDPGRLARLGLLHDVGIASLGIDISADFPATVSKESLDQSGSRMSPGIILRSLGVEDPALEEAIRCVHRTSTVKDHPPEKDPVVQIVGIATLVEMYSRGSGSSQSRDVHDATSVVLERHARAFGREVFRALLTAVPIYPVGGLVELSSGDYGRVVSHNPVNYFRPRVEIRVTGGGGGLPERRVIDLARAPFLHIRHRVTNAEASAAAGR